MSQTCAISAQAITAGRFPDSSITGLEKIRRMFSHEEGPVPWVEIAVDETLVLKGLQKVVPPDASENIRPIELSWEDRVLFARQMGLDALGIYHWEAFGSVEDDSHPVLSRTPMVLERSDLPKLQIPVFTIRRIVPRGRCGPASNRRQRDRTVCGICDLSGICLLGPGI